MILGGIEVSQFAKIRLILEVKFGDDLKATLNFTKVSLMNVCLQ